MAGDFRPGRRSRSGSTAATTKDTLPIHSRKPSRAVIEPKSTHVGDPFLQDFLDPSFDPAAFLNATLSPLQHPTLAVPKTATNRTKAPVPLANLSSEAQALTAQLDAHTTRLSSTLTQLTDDILRSGSRLTYEVEILRGETLSFAETLNEKLEGDIKVFLPGGLPGPDELKNLRAGPGKEEKTVAGVTSSGSAALQTASENVVAGQTQSQQQADGSAPARVEGATEPDYIRQLRTLTLVRDRLDSVIKTFGDAMEFVFPPSELSAASGFLSISAPEPGGMGPQGSSEGEKTHHSVEEKGQQVLKKIREEVAAMLRMGKDGQTGDAVEGIEKAAEKVAKLKELTVVWKGTGEEKGRMKFIESLAKMVEERHRELVREVEAVARKEGAGAGVAGASTSSASASTATSGTATRPRKGSLRREKAVEEEKKPLGGYGLMSQLQKLRSGL